MPNIMLQFSLFLISPRWGLDRKGRLAIESYIRGNNLALDVSSVLDGYADNYFKLDRLFLMDKIMLKCK